MDGREDPRQQDDENSSTPSYSSLDLPESNNTGTKLQDASEDSISEHLDSNRSGAENDRSLPEIDLDPTRLDPFESGAEPSEGTRTSLEKAEDVDNVVQALLGDILNDGKFRSKSESAKNEKSDSSSTRDVSLNIFEGVSLDDSAIDNYGNRLREVRGGGSEGEDVEKEGSVRKGSEESEELKTGSSFIMSATEYKGIEGKCDRVADYETAKTDRDTINALNEFLQQAIQERNEMEQKCESFDREVKRLTSELQTQLTEVSSGIRQQQRLASDSPRSPLKKEKDLFESSFAKLEDALSPNQLSVLNELRTVVSLYVRRKEDEVREEADEEMKKLRTYFEKKCADLEKNYSEEVFSQQSRKMSGSSTASGPDLIEDSENLGPGGDADRTKKFEICKSGLIEYEEELRRIRIEHQEEVNGLRQQLNEALENLRKNDVAVQEVGSSGDFEIADVVESYERRLQEQVALAKLDIINELVHQIQVFTQSSADTNWPPELLSVKQKFCEKYETEMEELKAKHAEELKLLKEEHFKVLNGALERARRRSSGDTEDLSETLKQTNSNLRKLISDLVQYCSQCEDELNRTLIDEITNATREDSSLKRVHFAPNLNLSILENSYDSNLSFEFKNGLVSSLERLKTDANAILALTTRMQFEPNTDNSKEEYIESLKTEIDGLIEKQNVLERELKDKNKRIAELIECGRKEVVSEGYGENNRSNGYYGKSNNLAELQERARHLVAEWKSGSDHPLIQLVEELCGEGERIADEAKRDKNDLKQQIDAADKKLRANCQFLEEQAAEREQERDDAQRRIRELEDRIRELERERQAKSLMATEVDDIQSQMQEMTKLIEAGEVQRREVECERREAVDKVLVLRDIVRDLEAQVEAKARAEHDLRRAVGKLEPAVQRQADAIRDLTAQLEEYRSGPDVDELNRRILELEKESQKLRLDEELIGSEGALREIQTRLREFERSIEKKTRELEGLHSGGGGSGTGTSTPSEEMSYKDHVRSNTPNGPFEECDVPLQQLARLKEKLIKHSRAEDAAVKRIRDLEMQLNSNKQELDEAQNEKEILQNQVSEQIVLLSSLQMRLDEQRFKAEQNRKAANTSLELKIYDLETEIQSLTDAAHAKDKTVKQLNKIVEETKRRLEDREKELDNRDDEAVVANFEKEIEKLKEENGHLKSKVTSDAQNAQILLGFVENIVADKNSDIETLRGKLDDTQRQLESFLSLNLDHDQLRHISRLRTSERGFSDFLNLTDNVPRKAAETQVDTIEFSMIAPPPKYEPSIQFENEVKSLREEIVKSGETEKELRLELAEKKMKLSEIEKDLVESVEDHKRKDDMLYNLTKQKSEIEKELKTKLEELENEIEDKLKLSELMDCLQKEIDVRNIEVSNLKIAEENLNKDITNLKEFLKEKDEVIAQMELDTKSLHVNLETIQNKIQETGNIVDLRKRLQEEKHLNAILREEIRSLRESEFPNPDKCPSIEEIKDKVQQQLDYSAHLDSNIIQVALSSGKDESETHEKDLEIKRLEKQLEEESEKVSKLSGLLEEERRNLDEIQVEDSNLIEQLRCHLEAALDAKTDLEMVIENERKAKMELENELKQYNSSSKSELTEYKKLPNVENEQLDRLKEELIILKDVNEKLKAEVKSLKKSKTEQSIGLKYSKDMLKMKIKELEKLELKLEEFRKIESDLKEKVIMSENEIESKSREIENDRILLLELERERIDLKKDQITLSERIRELEEERKINDILIRERESNLRSEVPETLVNKMRDLTVEIKKQMDENKILTNNLTQMAIERSRLLEKIRNLQSQNRQSTTATQGDRLNGKLLRSESYRKALVWQKRYLIQLLISYQSTSDVVTIFKSKYPKTKKPTTPRQKFKACAIIVVALCRMKFMVARWQWAYGNGKPLQVDREVEMRFEVGQPVSSQNFYPTSPVAQAVRFSSDNTDTRDAEEHDGRTSWSGSSPPQRDRVTHNRFAPLRSPQLLSEYVQRFDNIQQRLGLAFDRINS